jgi:hypothetical protein
MDVDVIDISCTVLLRCLCGGAEVKLDWLSNLNQQSRKSNTGLTKTAAAHNSAASCDVSQLKQCERTRGFISNYFSLTFPIQLVCCLTDLSYSECILTKNARKELVNFMLLIFR